MGALSGWGRIQGNQLQALGRVDRHVNMSTGVEFTVRFAVKVNLLLISAGLCACKLTQKQLI